MVRPDTAVLWALDAAKPGQKRHDGTSPRPTVRAGALAVQLTQRVHDTGRRFEQPELGALTHHDVEAILADLADQGWAANNAEGPPGRWIITPAGLDECQRRRTGQAGGN